MLKNKKVVIFDMDGTLIDSVGVWNAIDEELIKTRWNVKRNKKRIRRIKEK